MSNITYHMIEAMKRGFLPTERAELNNASFYSEDDLYSPTDRRNMAGHFVASAIVLSPSHNCALMIHHKFLDRLLFPGGHIDDREDPLVAAFREVFEETGCYARPLAHHPIDFDSHDIPVNPAKGEEAHRHHDMLFLGETSDDQQLALAEREIMGARWMTLDQIAALPERRFARVVAATRRYLSSM